MKIETIKDLEAVLKLCRKMHVVDISVDNLHCKLGDVPEKPAISQNDTTPAVERMQDEDVMFWSSGGAQ